MARSFDDDTPRRIRDADDLVQARRRDAGERIHVVTISLVIDEQEKRARRRWLDRIRRAGWAVSWPSVPDSSSLWAIRSVGVCSCCPCRRWSGRALHVRPEADPQVLSIA